MTHAEVRTIAEEALADLVKRGDYCLRPQYVRVCAVAKCEEEDGGVYWLTEITNANDPRLDVDMYNAMEPKMQDASFEVRSEW